MKILHIQVVDKVATYQMRDGSIICGNYDYQLEFTFDAEWSEHLKKTARFIWNGQYFDQEFTGTTCPVPVLNNTDAVTVGVYVGESADDAILSTTRELIPCIRSIRCGNASASNGTGENYTNEAKGYAEEARKYAEDLENAIAMKKGHSYTIVCQDLYSWNADNYISTIKKRFIAGDKLYNKLEVFMYDDELSIYDPFVKYDDEVAFYYGTWNLPKDIIFIDELTNDEKNLLDLLEDYEGGYNGEVGYFACGDKFLGLVDKGEETGTEWHTVGTYYLDFPGHIASPLYEITTFGGISTEPGVYSIRLRLEKDILANFTMVCNGDLRVNETIYSTPCYCTDLNKVVMLEMKHVQYISEPDAYEEYFEDHHLIRVKDMNGHDVTEELIGNHSYSWIIDNYENYYGGLEYTKLA